MAPEGRWGAERIAMGASLAAAVLMLVGKLSAALITGSDAILSDAAESVVHIAATGVAALSLWWGAQPADRQHPYGHGKIAYFSAGFEGAMIFAAALSILALAARSLALGPQVQSLGLGVAITAGLDLVNLALGVALVRVGRRKKALVLVANGKHVLTDMWTSAGVVVGVTLVWITDLVWLDPVVAILVGLNILWSGASLMKESFDGLMERVDDKDSAALLAALGRARAEALVVDYHQLHFRRVGAEVWIEVHLIFEEGSSLKDAHARASRCEAMMAESLEPAARCHITTHLEPRDHDASHPDGHPETVDPLTAPAG